MRLISTSDIIGELSGCAVRQHPYHAPQGLFELVQHVIGLCRRDFKDGVEGYETRWFNSTRDIYVWLKDALANNDTLAAWNTPRSGRAGHAFVSRYGGPPPEHDFIDIDALLGNVANGAWRDAAEFEKLTDEQEANK